MRILGMLSGTSVDGVDVAVADIDLADGVLRVQRQREASVPFDAALRERILAALPHGGGFADSPALCRLDADLGRAFGAAARTVLDHLDGDADLVVSHGQTVHHEVVDGTVLATLQLGQPAEIAEATGLPVVADLRARDVAAGGQGAPLVSLLDDLVLRGLGEPVAALNLGGIANLTVVRPGAPSIAFDAGPANGLLDAAVRLATDGREHHDVDGHLTASGTVDERLLARLLDDPFLAAPAPKSTGKERYHTGYLHEMLAAAPVDDLADRLATLAEAVAVAVADHAAPFGVRRLFASGGGVHNAGLVTALRARLAARDIAWDTTGALGLPVDGKEAIAFAVLGWHTWHGLSGTVPSCTGARGERVLGAIVPGTQALRLPEPCPTPPDRAEVLVPPTDAEEGS